MEVGSGKGLFLVAASELQPGHNFLGIEIGRKYAVLGGPAGAAGPNKRDGCERGRAGAISAVVS